jgi:hypothetical protein
MFHSVTASYKDLVVTNLAQIDGGTLAGTNQLYIGDQAPPVGPPQYAATLNWTGGILGGPNSTWVFINSQSTANLTGTAVKTLDGRNLCNYGTVTWAVLSATFSNSDCS